MLYKSALGLAMIWASFALSPLDAMSVKDFNAMSGPAQGQYVADYMLKMKIDLARTNPAFAAAVWDYFVQTAPGKTSSQGLEDVFVQQIVVAKLAKQGKADPSKIEIESIINYVIKQHFSNRP